MQQQCYGTVSQKNSEKLAKTSHFKSLVTHLNGGIVNVLCKKMKWLHGLISVGMDPTSQPKKPLISTLYPLTAAADPLGQNEIFVCFW